MRNACAFAKLLLKPTVDTECAFLAIRLLSESVASFGAKSSVAFRRSTSKLEIVNGVLRALNESHPSGWPIEMAAAQLSSWSRHFPSEAAAREFLLTKMQRTVLQKSEGRYRWTGEGL